MRVRIDLAATRPGRNRYQGSLYAGLHPDQVERFLGYAARPDADRVWIWVAAATRLGGPVKVRKVRAGRIAGIVPVT